MLERQKVNYRLIVGGIALAVILAVVTAFSSPETIILRQGKPRFQVMLVDGKRGELG